MAAARDQLGRFASLEEVSVTRSPSRSRSLYPRFDVFRLRVRTQLRAFPKPQADGESCMLAVLFACYRSPDRRVSFALSQA